MRRLQLDLTLDQVGRAVGVSKATVQRWESGLIKNLRRDKIARLAEILDLSPDLLVLGPEEESGRQSPSSLLFAAENGIGGAEMEENAAAIDAAALSATACRVGQAYDHATPKIQSIVLAVLDIPGGEQQA